MIKFNSGISIRKWSIFTVLAFLTASGAFAQNAEGIPRDWHHLDIEADGYPGISTELAYTLLKYAEAKPIIVAVIDSGIDTTHEDLKSLLWVNEDEIPNNGIDDDGNGYIDDIHGWNFIGGPEGNIEGESLELTRIYALLSERANETDTATWSSGERVLYRKVKSEYEAQSRMASFNFEYLSAMYNVITEHQAAVVGELGEDYTEEALMALANSDKETAESAQVIVEISNSGFTVEAAKEYLDYLEKQTKYHFNINLEENRREIVGDDPNDWTDTIYGNNDIMGNRSGHGTHVAGIIGAVRDNELGIDGIAANVRLMILRTVPDGDERDKDVAMAIRYAVRNGARIINMSFGKDYSPDYEKVQEAARRASERNILLVHAAGNDSRNLDRGDNYPFMPTGADSCWIQVGSSTADTLSLASGFSNYGTQTVDIFAPGEEIYSTYPVNKYRNNSGTSMAAPVVSGVAALILNYFPSLTAAELKRLLMETGDDFGTVEVTLPGTRETTTFSNLSRSARVVNAGQAVRKMLESSKQEVPAN